ncbi:MAG: alpha/beta hydrolase [Candidatus Limnocylindrales bacterium]
MVPTPGTRRAGVAAAVAALPVVFAYRFAQVYRVRAGYPRRHAPLWTPHALGMAFEEVEVPTADGLALKAWFMPAGDAPAPGIVLVHGWESARDRTLPHAQFLHAAGFHVLAVDVRGHGGNPPETLPISVGEFAADAAAGARWVAARPEVTRVGLLGHSMGAAGVLVAAARDPRVGAVVAVSTPADPYRLTRQTFRLAELPIPGVIAWPLAWLTARVYLRPRGHTIAGTSAARAVRGIAAPVLLVHGDDDHVVPVGHLARLAAIRRSARAGETETLVVHEGHHSWLYEFGIFRSTVARFLTAALGGPLDPDSAARAAEAIPASRLPEPERLTTLDEEPGGVRSLLGVFGRQSATSPDAGAPDLPATTAIPTTPEALP